MTDLYHECSMCHRSGLRPGILGTKHGDYGIRGTLKHKKELHLNEYGLCAECEALVENSLPQAPQMVEVARSPDGWSALLISSTDSTLWERTYPNGDLHGGGEPSLSAITQEQARIIYGYEA